MNDRVNGLILMLFVILGWVGILYSHVQVAILVSIGLLSLGFSSLVVLWIALGMIFERKAPTVVEVVEKEEKP
jgi:protein-S-isoprenylcysteine O-methyltransferase Ste14